MPQIVYLTGLRSGLLDGHKFDGMKSGLSTFRSLTVSQIREPGAPDPHPVDMWRNVSTA